MKKRFCPVLAALAAAAILSACGSKSPVDLDLSKMKNTLVYSTSIQIANDPEAYEGKTIRIRGMFFKVYSESQDREYYSCVARDEQGCCIEGIEFVLPEGESYPEEGEDITVSGTYSLYEEDGGLYGQLVDAKLE